MGLVFLAYPIAAFLGHPHAGAVVSNLLWPHFLHSKAFLLLGGRADRHDDHPVHAVLPDLGGGRQGRHPEDLQGGADRHDQRRDPVRRRLDLHHHRHRGGDRRHGATDQHRPGRRRAASPSPARPHRSCSPIGLLGASLLAATVVPLSTAYAIAETVGVERSLSRKLREAPFFYGIFTVQLVVGAAIALLPGNAVELVINAQVLNGFITPVLLTYILILANRRSVLGDAANGPVFRAVATVCVAVVGALSAVVLVQTVAGWL